MFGGRVYPVHPGQSPEDVLVALCDRLAPPGTLHTVYLVAPSSHCALHVRRMLALHRGVAGVETMPMARLAAVLADSSRASLSVADGCAAVCRVLRDPPALLRRHGQHDQARSAVWRALRAVRRMPPELLDALREEPTRGMDLHQLYASFRSLVNGRTDEEDLYEMAADRVSAWGAHDVMPSVVLYLPRRGSPGASRLLKALEDRDVLHTVTLDDDSANAGVLPASSSTGVSAADAAGVHAGVRIVRAHDPYDEVSAALSHVHLLSERGVPLHRIAILAPPSTPVAPVTDLCRAADVPVFCPAYMRLDGTLPARLLLDALRMAEEPQDADGWRAWLVQAPSALPKSYEDALKHLDVTVDAYRLAERLRADAAQPDPSADVGTTDLYRLLTLDVWRLNSRSPADWSAVSCALIDSCLPDGHPQLDGVIRAVERAGGCQIASLNRSEWRWVVQQELSHTVLPIGKAGEGVFVGTLAHARGIGFEHVWLLNAVEGELPGTPETSPLMPELEPLVHWRHEELAQVRQDVRERLALSSCTVSFSMGRPVTGQVLFPSRWLIEIASALHGQPVSGTDLMQMRPCAWLHHTDGLVTDPRVERPWSVASFRLQRLYELRGDLSALQSHPLVREDESLMRTLNVIRARCGGDAAWLGVGMPALALDNAISPMKLQMWAECPARFAMNCELGLPMPVEPDPGGRVKAVDIGSVIHALMRRWGVARRADRDVSSREMQEWVAEELQRLPSSTSVWREADAEQILLMFQQYVRWESQHINGAIRAVEWSFSLDATGLEPMVITGRVDRIDSDEQGVCVITDYKTGRSLKKKQFDQDCVVGGKQLQPALYSMAVERGMAERVAGFRFVMPGPIDTADCQTIDWPWNDASKQRSREVLQRIRTGLSRGEYPMNPGDDQKHCRYCCFTHICPVNRQRWTRHAWECSNLFDAYLGLIAGAESSEDAEDE